MEKFIVLLVLLAVSFTSPQTDQRSTQPIPVCHTTSAASAPDEMQLLASTKEFQLLHENPLPFHFTSKAGGEMVQFKTPDGKMANGFSLKASKPSRKYLFVFQEWWGLNDQIKQEAEKYYNSLDGKVNVLALDMYDGKVATTREDAGKLMSSASPERLENIVKGALDMAGNNAQIASIGWCFGGGWSPRSALLEGQKAVACVIYYGMPVRDVEKLKMLNTDVLGIFGSQDQGIPPATVAEFEKAMKAAGKEVTVKMYDAVHGFANPSNPKHDKEATADAYKLSSEYLKKRLL
ncbi:MAG: dienelactone hydrolase family protein [Cytophagaceae bacterium]|nr:dienelactone hydrolase family protein [Cytophagaceae bacterium]